MNKENSQPLSADSQKTIAKNAPKGRLGKTKAVSGKEKIEKPEAKKDTKDKTVTEKTAPKTSVAKQKKAEVPDDTAGKTKNTTKSAQPSDKTDENQKAGKASRPSRAGTSKRNTTSVPEENLSKESLKDSLPATKQMQRSNADTAQDTEEIKKAVAKPKKQNSPARERQASPKENIAKVSSTDSTNIVSFASHAASHASTVSEDNIKNIASQHTADSHADVGEVESSGMQEDSDAQEKTSSSRNRRNRSRRNRKNRASRARQESAELTPTTDDSEITVTVEDGIVGDYPESAVHISAWDEQDSFEDELNEPAFMDDDDDDDDETFDLDDEKPEAKTAGKNRKASARSKDKDASSEESPSRTSASAQKKMFVSVIPGEQIEVVLTEEGSVQEYYVEMLHQTKVKGNIYKGVIHNIDANLQAAFISYGASKNGFLQIDEVHPEYYLTNPAPEKGRKYPPIQKILKAGQEILVQVVKEPAGTKGAFLTSYLSMAGRFLVLTPGREQIGVSRKVESEEERARLRELLNGLTPGPGLGVIVRTVSMGASKTALQRDLQYLKRVWRDVRKKGTVEKAPCLLHQEADLTTRAVRDYLTEEVVEVWVDDAETAGQISEIVSLLFPRREGMVQIHNDPSQGLFSRFTVQKQLDQVHSREVSLPSGGRLVFDPTEALTAIDINSGRSSGKHNFEDMAYRINLEAAQAIPLQLRLRDIGGQIVVDFIEMRDRNHWREVERTFRNGMKVDRARHDVGRISSFGLLEIVRQRIGSSAISISMEPCPACRGTGMRRNMEWQALQAIKEIQRQLHHAQGQNQNKLVYANSPELILYILNQKREKLTEMEKLSGISLELRIQ